MTEAERNRSVVARLMTILSGDTPIETGIELMVPNVVAHVDGWRFEGINVWANWIQYLRTRGRVAEPTLQLEELAVESDASITARGRWKGFRDDRPVTSHLCVARYRLTGGRIEEIWSTRRNYALLCGAHVEYRGGFALELLRVQQWKRRAPQLDLLGRARPRPRSLPTLAAADSLGA